MQSLENTQILFAVIFIQALVRRLLIKAQQNKNLGYGAGGKNTNRYGKSFEDKTDNQTYLINDGFVKGKIIKSKTANNKYNVLFEKQFVDKKITYVSQNGLKLYFKEKYKIELFRCPDEAYIIEKINGEKIVLIVEKKEQRVEGSVETKLWSGPSLKREYELVIGNNWQIHYCYCVSEFLENKLKSKELKYKTLNIILEESNIKLLYGDSPDYFQQLQHLIYNI